MKAIKASGDMTKKQKADFDRDAYRKIRRTVELQTAYCAEHGRALRTGAFDLDKNLATMEAMQRLMAIDLTRRRFRDAGGQWKYADE